MRRSINQSASASTDGNSLSKTAQARGLVSVSPRQSQLRNSLLHLTVAAAAQAAATVLLTKKTLRQVRINLPDGCSASFKLQECILENGSALCAIASPRQLPASLVETVPEIWVRVSWEQKLLPRFTETPPDQLLTGDTMPDMQGEILWLTLDGYQEASADSGSSAPIVPLVIYFGTTPDAASLLAGTPRELISQAIKAALSLVPTYRIEGGLRVAISLVKVASG